MRDEDLGPWDWPTTIVHARAGQPCHARDLPQPIAPRYLEDVFRALIWERKFHDAKNLAYQMNKHYGRGTYVYPSREREEWDRQYACWSGRWEAMLNVAAVVDADKEHALKTKAERAQRRKDVAFYRSIGLAPTRKRAHR